MSYITRTRTRHLGKPTRCNYCKAGAVVWVRYRSCLSPNISHFGGGWKTLYMASCVEHDLYSMFMASRTGEAVPRSDSGARQRRLSIQPSRTWRSMRQRPSQIHR